jgi:hypothetical protein
MTFTIEDYEKAIARIFLLEKSEEHVIGTGFLIAPGYVLTCAHVVLQANKVPEDDFNKDEYKKKPEIQITLDFPVLASGQKINAKVVEWLSYNLDNGDVAVLKLVTPEPEGAKPMPLVTVSLDEVKKDPHSVYGFSNKIGGRSDAYRPKANVAGGRFQFCKDGNSNDETIKSGFSGAPVWNNSRKSVIGMVATALEAEKGQSQANAIPTQQLQTVLKKVNVLWLNDILTKSLNEDHSNDERDQFRKTIDAALRHCNPQGGSSSWQQQLEDLSNHPAPRGWEEGKLVYFVMILCQKLYQIPDKSKYALEQLEAWVDQCRHKFSDLFTRIVRENKDRNVSPSNECECVMVAVEEVETSTDELRVSLWAVLNRETYNAHDPPMPLVSEKVLSRQELPAFVRDLIREKLNPEPTPTIHLFVPRKLFGEDFEMLSASSRLGAVLGSEYPFVVRTNLQTHPIGAHYKHDWHKKWKQLEEALEKKSGSEVKIIDCSQPPQKLISKIKGIYAARLKECNSVDELFDLIAEATVLPVALWSRDPQFEQKHLAHVLKSTVKELPERIRQEREKAYKSEKKPLLGHHLSLVWEDPKIVPPDMQFNPEMF